MQTDNIISAPNTEEPAMENESRKNSPILDLAWSQYADLNASSSRGTRVHYTIRRWIALLGVLATLFAILSQLYPRENPDAPEGSWKLVLGLVIRILLVATPLVASAIAYVAMRKFSNGSWLVKRAGAEEVLKEIYYYRTVLQKNKNRRRYLEKRLNEIQRQVYISLGGEYSFEGYNGPIPPHYNPNDPNSDPGFDDLTGEQYFKRRLEEQLSWHNRRINQYQVERDRIQWIIIGFGVLGALLAAFDESTVWVALTASITAAYVGWQELRNLDAIIKNYSKVVLELKILYNHWINLEPEERTTAEFYKMVHGCEQVLWAQNTEYIKSMQEALKDSDLEEEASLVNRVIRESVDSARRTKQAMHDTIAEGTRVTLEHAEEQVGETFQAAWGSLAEEASSELVQQELAAMREAAAEWVENAVEKASDFASSLEQIAKEFSNVEVGRDTAKEELNAILSRYPKTSEVKG